MHRLVNFCVRLYGGREGNGGLEDLILEESDLSPGHVLRTRQTTQVALGALEKIKNHLA